MIEMDDDRFLGLLSQRLGAYVRSRDDVEDKVVRLTSPEELARSFEEESGVALRLEERQEETSNETLLSAVDALLRYSVKTSHPLFLNQLYGRADVIGVGADWTSTALNTNTHTYEVAPAFTLMENALLSKIGRTIGWHGEDKNEVDGLFVPGGSLSNLYGMHVSRNVVDPEVATRGSHGGPRLVAFTSDQSHYSYLKSARLMGIGSDNLIAVESDAHGRMRPDALEESIERARRDGGMPFFVGSTAGTTVLGAYDPLDKISEVCARQGGLWHHVDACWGGGAMLSSRYRHVVRGIETTDSVAWNPHKMSGAPLQCSVFLTRRPGVLKNANATNAAYLFQPDKLHGELDSGDKTIQCGRKTDMLKLWMLWKKRGDDGMASFVDRCFDLATFTGDVMRENEDLGWKLAYEPSCANVCFWYVPARLREDARRFLQVEGQGEGEQETRFSRELHKVAPLVKSRMQREGDAMIGFQSVNGLPNFFRLVFPSGDAIGQSDVLEMLERMRRFGEEEYEKFHRTSS